MLGLGLANGVLQGIAGRQQANAQAAIAEMRQNNANFQQQLEIDRQNRNILRQFEDALVYNKRLEDAAIRDRAKAELSLEDSYTNAKSQFSRQTQQTNAAMITTFAGKGVDPNSGSARAILRSNLSNAALNMVTLSKNYADSLEDIELGYQNRLNQRADTSGVGLVSFIPNTTPVANGGSSALMQGILGGVLGGLQGEANMGSEGLFG
jgi:hypothetical protein